MNSSFDFSIGCAKMTLNHLGPLAELTCLDKTIRFLEIICVELSKGVSFHTEFHISDKCKSRLP